MSPDPPNIVLIHAHDLGQTLGCYGRAIDTPAIDALATQGARLTNCTAAAPQCSPSRASMTTGRYPHNHGLMGLVHRGWELYPDAPRLPAVLAAAGYQTHLFGIQHEAPTPEDLGYQSAHAESRALHTAERFTEQLPEIDGEDPFFASIGFAEPHLPFRREYVEDEAYDYYHPENVEVPPYLPDEHGVRRDVAAMQGLITATVDPAVGRIVSAIDAAGLTEETVIIFTTDHGPALPRAKGMCYSAGVDIACIARWPGVIEPGRRDALVSNVDLLPTLAEFANTDLPAPIDGQSFAGILTGDSYEERDHVFVEITWHDRYNPIRGIRASDFTYLRNFSMLPRVYIPRDIIDQPAARPVRGSWYDQERPAEEFYDRRADPHELENLAEDRRIRRSVPADWDLDEPPATLTTEQVASMHHLRTELQAWMEQTDDPLLTGPVGIPGSR